MPGWPGLVIALDLLTVAAGGALLGDRLDERDVTLLLLVLAVTIYGPVRAWAGCRRTAGAGRPARRPVRRGLRPRGPARGDRRRRRPAAGARRGGRVDVQARRSCGSRSSYTPAAAPSRPPTGSRPRDVREVADPVRAARGRPARAAGARRALDAVATRPGACSSTSSGRPRWRCAAPAGRRPAGVPRAAGARPRGRPPADPARPARRARAGARRRGDAARRSGQRGRTATPRRAAELVRLVPHRRAPTRWPTYGASCTGCGRRRSTTSGSGAALDQQAERLRADARGQRAADGLPGCPRRSRWRRTGSCPRRSPTWSSTPRATRCTISLRAASAGILLVEVGDDGRGIAPDVVAGVGPAVDARTGRGARRSVEIVLPGRRRHPGAGVAAAGQGVDLRRRPMTETVRVLIADDHPVFRDGLASLLGR